MALSHQMHCNLFETHRSIVILQHYLDEHQMGILHQVYEQTLNCVLFQRPLIQLIEGPAGTGKTRVLISLVMQLIDESTVNRGCRPKVLVCAMSNESVDRIAYELMPMQRLGKSSIK